jgi:hypothetical protein
MHGIAVRDARCVPNGRRATCALVASSADQKTGAAFRGGYSTTGRFAYRRAVGIQRTDRILESQRKSEARFRATRFSHKKTLLLRHRSLISPVSALVLMLLFASFVSGSYNHLSPVFFLFKQASTKMAGEGVLAVSVGVSRVV